MSAAEQTKAFFAMFLCGAACALAHDAARLAGWILGGRRGFNAVMDLAFGPVLAAGMTYTGLYLGTEPIRMYLFAGMMMGVLLWRITGGGAARVIGARVRSRFTNRQKRDE